MVTHGVARRQSLRRRVTTGAGGHASLSRCGCLRSEVGIFRTRCGTYWCSRAGRRASRRRAISPPVCNAFVGQSRVGCVTWPARGVRSVWLLHEGIRYARWVDVGSRLQAKLGDSEELYGLLSEASAWLKERGPPAGATLSAGPPGNAHFWTLSANSEAHTRRDASRVRVTGHDILGLTRHLHGRSECRFFSGGR
jgi:hypothetical protein